MVGGKCHYRGIHIARPYLERCAETGAYQADKAEISSERERTGLTSRSILDTDQRRRRIPSATSNIVRFQYLAMPQIGGLEVWIEMEGARLEEFGVERDDTSNTVTCWIPCQEGKVRQPNLPRAEL